MSRNRDRLSSASVRKLERVASDEKHPKQQRAATRLAVLMAARRSKEQTDA